MRLFGLITVALVAMAVIAITPVLSQNMKEPTITKDQSGMGEGIKIHGENFVSETLVLHNSSKPNKVVKSETKK